MLTLCWTSYRWIERGDYPTRMDSIHEREEGTLQLLAKVETDPIDVARSQGSQDEAISKTQKRHNLTLCMDSARPVDCHDHTIPAGPELKQD